ncbi:MAG: large-conductance mechanosensitive channel protein MscL [Syntrophorhabdus sp.]
MGKDFRDFIMRGNVVDMAVGIIIGAAFVAIVKSLVDDIIMPPIGLLLGNIDFSNFFVVLKSGKIPGPYETVAQAKAAGAVTINYGFFINNIISFLIVAFSVFMLIRTVTKLKKEPAPAEVTTKECPFCLSTIPVKAVKCAHCTAEIK